MQTNRRMILRLLLASLALATALPQARAQSHEQTLEQKHFVFVTGYNSEKIPGYMTENMRILLEAGAIHLDQIRPPSETAVVENIPFVKQRLKDLFEQGGRRPLTLVAHSKGGLETLNTLLRNPKDFPPEVVERVYVVQSPIGGSPYTDRVMAKWDRSIFSWNPMYWLLRSQHAGFLSMLSQRVNQDLSESAARSTPEELASLSQRTFILRSSKALDKVSPSLKESAADIRDLGPNDGLVPTEKMLFAKESGLQGFGTDLGVMNADHLEQFALGEPASQARANSIANFTRKILAHVMNGSVSARPMSARASCKNAF